MLSFSKQDILLGQVASNVEQAIAIICNHLQANQRVTDGYVDGMLERERSISTYLDNGIAIPHAVPSARQFVQQTGVAIVQFPQGVKWNDDGDMVYVAFGIASRDNEHLEMLKSISLLLTDEELTGKLAQASDLNSFYALLNNDATQEAAAPALDLPLIAPVLIDLNSRCRSLDELVASNFLKLYNYKAVDASFLESLAPHLHLGHGVWLSSAVSGNKADAVAFARLTTPVQYQGNSVNALVTVALAKLTPALAQVTQDDSFKPRSETFEQALDLSWLLNEQVLQKLANLEQAGYLYPLVGVHPDREDDDTNDVFTPVTTSFAVSPADEVFGRVQEGCVVRTFKITNENGLHARPATYLAHLCKQYQAQIMVRNLADKNSKPVSAKSLLNLLSLNATFGCELEFTFADASDVDLASQAVAMAVAANLGE